MIPCSRCACSYFWFESTSYCNCQSLPTPTYEVFSFNHRASSTSSTSTVLAWSWPRAFCPASKMELPYAATHGITRGYVLQSRRSSDKHLRPDVNAALLNASASLRWHVDADDVECGDQEKQHEYDPRVVFSLCTTPNSAAAASAAVVDDTDESDDDFEYGASADCTVKIVPSSPIPLQANTSDCGVFTCYYAHYLLERISGGHRLEDVNTADVTSNIEQKRAEGRLLQHPRMPLLLDAKQFRERIKTTITQTYAQLRADDNAPVE
jgi:hypothetical protein